MKLSKNADPTLAGHHTGGCFGLRNIRRVLAVALVAAVCLLLPFAAYASGKKFEPYRDFLANPKQFESFAPQPAMQAALCVAWEKAREHESAQWENHGFFPYTALNATQKNALSASPSFLSVYYQDKWWGKPLFTNLPFGVQEDGEHTPLAFARAFTHAPAAADKTLRAFLQNDWQEERRGALVESIQSNTRLLEAFIFFPPQSPAALRDAEKLAEETFTLILYNELLTLYAARWEKPEETLQWLVPMREIAPDNPFFALTHAELMVQQERPQAALESMAVFFDTIQKLTGIDPSPAALDLQRQGYEVRGLAFFLSGKIRLAEEDYTRALAEKPTGSLFLSRGIVRQTKNDMPAACEDFYLACSLGACEGLVTAREKGLCPGSSEGPNTAAPQDTAEGKE